ncbi:hypothetical protein ACHAXA_006908 [Cyclostephanos tholiformis]|uniref:Uncharacterized protein n=1 Tax=Cyclostephanos tholiformis TaxID=382380 RepID=A0ABD3SDD4_9STRA
MSPNIHHRIDRPPPNGHSKRRSSSPAAESNDDSNHGSYDHEPWRERIDRLHRPSPVPSGSSQRSTPPAFHGSVVMNGTFQKLIGLLVLIVIFDVVYLWDFFHGIDEKSDGPEAGIHNLHETHRSRKVLTLLQQVIGGGTSSVQSGSPDNFDSLTDEEKIDELEKEIYEWKDKYEKAMKRLHEDPYPDGPPNVPFTPRPPNREDTYEFKKVKKSRAELAKTETYGVHKNIVNILHSASVEIDKELADQLPTWENVVSMYGDKPVISGLETCEPYRKAVKPEDRMIGPAGMFNTGTNLLFELMKTNCDIKEARRKFREPKRNGMRWQVPWGKHNPPTTHRFKNVAKAWGKGIKQGDFFPVVLIKDPYTWMGSQCRHKYATFWGHDDEHCPNLVRWKITDAIVPSEVRVKFALEMKMFDSLLDIWNKWYQEWESMTFPHIITRFEDLLFHGEEVTRKACECVGGVFAEEFQYVEDSAKKAVGVHKGANGLVMAMLHYGDPTKRLTGFTDRDRIYADKFVDYELMKKYHYPKPPLPAGVAPLLTKEKGAYDEEENEQEKTDKNDGEEEEEEGEEEEKNGTDDGVAKEESGTDEEESNEENGTDDHDQTEGNSTDDEDKDKEKDEEEEEKDEQNVEGEGGEGGVDLEVEEGEKEIKADDETDQM